MKKLNATVIIWGNDNYNVLGLLRQLTPYVKDVIFLANKNARGCASKSRYCKRIKIADTQEKALSYLKENGKACVNKSFLITTSDLLAEYVDQHKRELSQYYVLSTTSEQGILTKALNKEYQCKLAREVGFNVPITFVVKKGTKIYYDKVNYPCIIKPAFKEVGVNHPFKTCICKNEKELRTSLMSIDGLGTYILQQYVEKESDLLIYGCRLENGSVKYAGSFSKYRWAGGDGSYGIIHSAIPECINVKNIELFLDRIGYYGFFSAEFGIEKGIAWFYEFNLRNDGTSHYFYQSGKANIPLYWVMNHLEDSPAFFIDEIGDLDNVSLGLLTKEEWNYQKNKAVVFKYYDPSDKKPYYHMKVMRFLSYVYHTLLKR